MGAQHHADRSSEARETKCFGALIDGSELIALREKISESDPMDTLSLRERRGDEGRQRCHYIWYLHQKEVVLTARRIHRVLWALCTDPQVQCRYKSR